MTCFNIAGDLRLNETETDIILITGLGGIKQQIDIGATIFLKFWRYDQSKGLPFLEQILLKGATKATIRTIWYNFLRSIGGVLSVESLTVDIDAERTATVNYKVRCEDGVIDGTLPFDLATR